MGMPSIVDLTDLILTDEALLIGAPLLQQSLAGLVVLQDNKQARPGARNIDDLESAWQLDLARHHFCRVVRWGLGQFPDQSTHDPEHPYYHSHHCQADQSSKPPDLRRFGGIFFAVAG